MKTKQIIATITPTAAAGYFYISVGTCEPMLFGVTREIDAAADYIKTCRVTHLVDPTTFGHSQPVAIEDVRVALEGN